MLWGWTGDGGAKGEGQSKKDVRWGKGRVWKGRQDRLTLLVDILLGNLGLRLVLEQLAEHAGKEVLVVGRLLGRDRGGAAEVVVVGVGVATARGVGAAVGYCGGCVRLRYRGGEREE